MLTPRASPCLYLVIAASTTCPGLSYTFGPLSHTASPHTHTDTHTHTHTHTPSLSLSISISPVNARVIDDRSTCARGPKIFGWLASRGRTTTRSQLREWGLSGGNKVKNHLVRPSIYIFTPFSCFLREPSRRVSFCWTYAKPDQAWYYD